MSIHAKLSASGAHRWLACPGSVKAEDGIPDTTSTFAQEGTAAHELGEISLVGGTDCSDMIGTQLLENDAYSVTPEMADAVQVYVDVVRYLGGEQMYEERVDFSEWVPDGFGTSDAIVLNETKMSVIDLKYGKGHRVEAQDNAQGILYALGAYAAYGYLYDIQTVEIIIVQPRLDHISVWELSIEDLLKKGEWISQRAEMTQDPQAQRVPGEAQCQWCKAKANCGALQKFTHDVIATDFDNLDKLSNPDTLTDEELRAALDAKKLVVSWLDAVETVVTQRLAVGEDFDGYKMVAGRSSRNWNDESQAATVLESALGVKAWERKLTSPAKAEKLLAKSQLGLIESLISSKEGRPTLARESDPRPAVGATAMDFDVIHQDD
jgi:hypothetical protein